MAWQSLFALTLLLYVALCQAFTLTVVPVKPLGKYTHHGGAHQHHSSSFLLTTKSSSSNDSSSSTVDTDNQRDVSVQELLTTARQVGQVGSLASPQDQEKLLQMAQQLVSMSDPNPAQRPLEGVHTLVYSAAPGGSSGRLVGPFYGKVQQTFLKDGEFINRVQLGPLEIALKAKCGVKNATTNKVTFQETSISLFGKDVVTKEASGGGEWNYLFLGVITNVDGTRKLIRVMTTPSLFILEQPLPSL